MVMNKKDNIVEMVRFFIVLSIAFRRYDIE